MNRAVLALGSAEKTIGEVAKLQFRTQSHPSYHVRVATGNDMKCVEERKYTIKKERTIPEILEDISRLVRLYNLVEYQSIIQKIALQYKNISDQITLYREQIRRYEGDGKDQFIAQKREQILHSFKEEEDMVNVEIASYQQTIDTYHSKIDSLHQEEATLSIELDSMKAVLTRYEELIQQNTKLEEAVQNEHNQLEEITTQKRRTYNNILSSDELNRALELDRQRLELDQSEREEAMLMIELEGILKESESSTTLSIIHQYDEIDEQQKILSTLQHHREILRHVCEEFVYEGRKENSEIGIAMSILLRNGGEMSLSDLKSDMKSELSDNPSIVLSTIYSLVGNQIIRIDRSMKEQKVICMI